MGVQLSLEINDCDGAELSIHRTTGIDIDDARRPTVWFDIDLPENKGRIGFKVDNYGVSILDAKGNALAAIDLFNHSESAEDAKEPPHTILVVHKQRSDDIAAIVKFLPGLMRLDFFRAPGSPGGGQGSAILENVLPIPKEEPDA